MSDKASAAATFTTADGTVMTKGDIDFLMACISNTTGGQLVVSQLPFHPRSRIETILHHLPYLHPTNYFMSALQSHKHPFLPRWQSRFSIADSPVLHLLIFLLPFCFPENRLHQLPLAYHLSLLLSISFSKINGRQACDQIAQKLNRS
jgi:hypothetical protein